MVTAVFLVGTLWSTHSHGVEYGQSFEKSPDTFLLSGRTNKTMMGERVLTADDVANTVLFLASPLSDLIQGETITVDGGVAIHV